MSYQVTKRNEGILNVNSSLKKASLKRLHTVWFQLYDTLAKPQRQENYQWSPEVRRTGNKGWTGEHRKSRAMTLLCVMLQWRVTLTVLTWQNWQACQTEAKSIIYSTDYTQQQCINTRSSVVTKCNTHHTKARRQGQKLRLGGQRAQRNYFLFNFSVKLKLL